MDRKDDMLETLAKLVAWPSVSCIDDSPYPFGENVYRTLCSALEVCESLGMETKKCGNYLGYAQAGQGKRLIGVLVHLDVVPAGEGWETDPFRAEIRGDRIYGRGVMDDKGPAAAVIYAVKDLMDQGMLKDKRVRIIFGCSEETGEWEDIDYYKQTEELPECGFTPDGDFPLIFAEKGIANVVFSMALSESGIEEAEGGDAINVVPGHCRLKASAPDGNDVTVETEGRPAHASTPEEGTNAIGLAMERLKGVPFAEFYMACFGNTWDGSLMNCALRDEVSGPITVNPGVIRVEDGNIRLYVDIRYPVTFTSSEVMDRIEKAVLPWNVEAKLVYDERPMFVEKESALCRTLLSAYREVTGDMTEPQAMGGGTYAKAMENILAFGPVFPGRECREHQNNEYILIEDLYRARQIYALALSRL